MAHLFCSQRLAPSGQKELIEAGRNFSRVLLNYVGIARGHFFVCVAHSGSANFHRYFHAGQDRGRGMPKGMESRVRDF